LGCVINQGYYDHGGINENDQMNRMVDRIALIYPDAACHPWNWIFARICIRTYLKNYGAVAGSYA
jgi:hypothetical protein